MDLESSSLTSEIQPNRDLIFFFIFQHEPVGRLNPAVQLALIGTDALCFHLPDSRPLMDGGYQVKPLPHIGL